MSSLISLDDVKNKETLLLLHLLNTPTNEKTHRQIIKQNTTLSLSDITVHSHSLYMSTEVTNHTERFKAELGLILE